MWIRSATTHVTHCNVMRLTEHAEYKFRVFAENIFGTSDPSPETDAVLIQEPKIEIDYDKLGEYP